MAKEKKQYQEQRLFCDNPQCDKQILDEKVAYDKANNRFYHAGDCTMLSTALITFKTGKQTFFKPEYLDRKTALELAAERDAQKNKLEREVDKGKENGI